LANSPSPETGAAAPANWPLALHPRLWGLFEGCGLSLNAQTIAFLDPSSRRRLPCADSLRAAMRARQPPAGHLPAPLWDLSAAPCPCGRARALPMGRTCDGGALRGGRWALPFSNLPARCWPPPDTADSRHGAAPPVARCVALTLLALTGGVASAVPVHVPQCGGAWGGWALAYRGRMLAGTWGGGEGGGWVREGSSKATAQARPSATVSGSFEHLRGARQHCQKGELNNRGG
jgi:hypothetical protein